MCSLQFNACLILVCCIEEFLFVEKFYCLLLKFSTLRHWFPGTNGWSLSLFFAFGTALPQSNICITKTPICGCSCTALFNRLGDLGWM